MKNKERLRIKQSAVVYLIEMRLVERIIKKDVEKIWKSESSERAKEEAREGKMIENELIGRKKCESQVTQSNEVERAKESSNRRRNEVERRRDTMMEWKALNS